MSGALDAIAAALRAEGGLLAEATRDPWPHDAEQAFGDLAASGPRAAGRGEEIAFVVEAVWEGHLAHHGVARVVDQQDADLALLVGDRLYALGLERLAAAGDLVSVRALADVIALAAQAVAAGDRELLDAVWRAGAVEVGWGGSASLQDAKSAARADRQDAAQRLLTAARSLAGDVASGPSDMGERPSKLSAE